MHSSSGSAPLAQLRLHFRLRFCLGLGAFSESARRMSAIGMSGHGEHADACLLLG